MWTGATLAALVAPAVWFLPREVLLGIAMLVVAWGAFEWGGLVGGRAGRWWCASLCVAAASWLWWTPFSDHVWLFAAAGWWLAIVAMVSAFSPDFCSRSWCVWILRAHVIVAMTAFWYAVGGLLHLAHRGWLLYVIALTAACDVAAYYAGRRFGRRKLCPDLSPGKTREGLLGALAAAFATAAAATALLSLDPLDAVYFVLLSLFVCLLGIVGDLIASMAKRCAGVKDSEIGRAHV